MELKQFEPKMKNRFEIVISDDNYFHSWFIESVERPKCKVSRFFRKIKWEPIELTFHDPICPSSSQFLYNWVITQNGLMKKNKKKVIINLLGPIGDIVEQWVLEGCTLKSIDFGFLDCSSLGSVKSTCVLEMEKCSLSY